MSGPKTSGDAGDVAGLMRDLAAGRGESYERFLAGLPSVAPGGDVAPMATDGARAVAACEAFRGGRPDTEQEGVGAGEQMHEFEVGEGVTAFCLESPKAPKVGNFADGDIDFEDCDELPVNCVPDLGAGSDEAHRVEEDPGSASPARELAAEIETAGEGHRDTVEPFVLDPTFDYDNIELTPRFGLGKGVGD